VPPISRSASVRKGIEKGGHRLNTALDNDATTPDGQKRSFVVIHAAVSNRVAMCLAAPDLSFILGRPRVDGVSLWRSLSRLFMEVVEC
jgi:hypothetical protein